MYKNSNKALVLFSGGVESMVVATLVAKSQQEVHLFHLYQGQQNITANMANIVAKLKEVSKNDQIFLHCFDMTPFIEMLNGKSEVDKYVPGYWLYGYTTALSLCEKLDIIFVYTGEIDFSFVGLPPHKMIDSSNDTFHKHIGVSDEEFLKETNIECRNEVCRLYSYMYAGGNKNYYTFIDPLVGLTKPGVVSLGKALNAPLELSISCRNKQIIGDNTHCGICYACYDRKAAFVLANVPDPTLYINKELPPADYMQKASLLFFRQ